ncbi:hypothetical protein [Nocardioides sp.]|uniref:hypothetical protein n=1 Tax=Nocardioides sp. TaxID=35761 RepID=UPI002CED92F7|nr:hypothetical protein [Nocardioides sp.]HXH78404.1 hypothetical protein [Nocardioides sp.]
MNRILTLLIAARLTLNVRRERPERGSVTIEHVIWAVAVIAIVAIVVAAVRAYVTTQAGNIQ